jgi:hypothetical protein
VTRPLAPLRILALACTFTFALACVTELPRSAPRPPTTEFVVEIVVADGVGAITASIEEPETIARVLASWSLSSDDWRAPWIQDAPLYWIEFYGEAAANLPPRVYGLGRAGSRWWLSADDQSTRWMKALPTAEERELLFDLEVPGYLP